MCARVVFTCEVLARHAASVGIGAPKNLIHPGLEHAAGALQTTPIWVV